MRNLLIILTTISFLLVAGCGQTQIPNAVVQPTQLSVNFPQKNAIESVDIASDSAGSMGYSPNNPSATISQILSWLQTAQPVSVQFPKVNVKTGPSGGYTGPSILHLTLKGNRSISVFPAYYLVPHKNGYDYRYLDGIVEYHSSGNPVYLKCPALYQWLKKDQWVQQFHMMGK